MGKIIITDDDMHEYGILTRSKKGEELTINEMDNNIRSIVGMLSIAGVGDLSLEMYPSISSAPSPTVTNNDDIEITVPVKNGFCFISLANVYDGVSVNPITNVTKDAGITFFNSDYYMSGYTSKTAGDTYFALVGVGSDVTDVTFRMFTDGQEGGEL